MRYLCLVYGEEKMLDGLSQREATDLVKDSLAYDDVLEKNGQLIVAHALPPVRESKTVRVRNGRTLVIDGPFAETKEQLLGFILIEAESQDQAVEIASRIPLAGLGSIEVRSIRKLTRDETARPLDSGDASRNI